VRGLERHFVRLSTLGALIGLALAASGCQEPRSYAIRWRVEPRTTTDPPTAEPQTVEMSNPSVCSRAGVSDIEVWVFDELNQLADRFESPCFPGRFRTEGGAIRGATLSPGDYTLIIAGTRANGLPWGTCPDETAAPDDSGDTDADTDGFVDAADTADTDGDDTALCTGASVSGFLGATAAAGAPLCVEGECNVGLDTCDCTTFTVEAEKTRRLDDFVLAAPPDCEDGIDGDEDGLVDQLDPGCQLGVSESTPVLSPELELSISVLSGNPVADCDNIGVGALSLTIDGNEVDPILCNIGTTRFSTPLAVGSHTLTVTGVEGTGTFTPLTVEKSLEFSVNDRGVASPRSIEIDFADVDLLEPLEGPIWFLYEFAPEQDEQGPLYCKDVGATDVRYRVLDLGGQEVSSFPAPLDGSLTPCVSMPVISDERPRWGGYMVEIEAFNADGDLCWSNADDPAFLTPTESELAVVPRAENAPASCFNG